jgi:hypothetical protein
MGINGEEYTPKQIRMNKSRIVYWIIFPQGIEEYRKNGKLTTTTYSHMMTAKTLKKAIRLYNKYNGAYVERMLQCKLGRWTIKEFGHPNKTIDELWDEYSKLPKIIL